LVKENPKQDYQQRGAEFFRRLSTIKNATYIAKEVDTYYLMAHSQFVATITGTAGWESITGGKPCLVFGLAWYAQIPGVIKYSSTITVDEILETKINQQDQKNAFEKMYRKTRQGLVDCGYQSIFKDYSVEKNSTKLQNFLEEIILKN
jgi:capsule polysaccharide export protein KpsC/LpsZ